ncbi:MAG TPA: hypothetical protein VGS07_29870 [Thermoanaerobaculia bacterium]|nr:hypothetical protein [Thermoanaerobaculia bacterium]
MREEGKVSEPQHAVLEDKEAYSERDLLNPAAAGYWPGVLGATTETQAVSQSEHSGLFYEAANGTKFVGTPSAGANGDVTDLTLPGGARMFFTGHDVESPCGS